MPKLETPVALPKSKSGRQAAPLDIEFLNALIEAIQKVPVVDDRPALHGSSDRYPSKSRAGAAGRRYADRVQDALGVEKVSVRTDEYAVKNGTPVFGWKLYIPVAAVVTVADSYSLTFGL